MKRIAMVLVLLSATYVDLNAQSTASFHVFPQVADGLQSDGSSFYSTLAVTNVGTRAATCTIRLYGAVSSHITGSTVLAIPAAGGLVLKNTSLADGIPLQLATGYATLTCDQSVAAQVGYFYVAPGLPNFNLLGGATVFSSPPTTRAELLVANTVGFTTAFAIANDTDTAAQYQISILNDSLQQVASATIPVPARSNIARFVNEVVQLPSGYPGGAAIISSTSGPFSVVGLLFKGTTFLSLAAVPFPTTN